MKIKITRKQWNGTRESLDREVAKFRQQLEDHKKTVNVPAPLPDYDFIGEIARKNLEYELQPENEVLEPEHLDEFQKSLLSRLQRRVEKLEVENEELKQRVKKLEKA